MLNEEYGFIIDTMQWSYSRLSSYYNCKHEWKWHYIDCNKGSNNFYSQYGSFMHEILERYAKGQLSIFEISQFYEDNYESEITEPVPYNKYTDIGGSYYEKGLDYLDNIDLDLEKYEILGVEKKVEFEIGGYPFVGFIDLLLKDKKTKEIIILDHKSASIKFLKNGGISKGDREHVEDFKRQLYLYSIPILEEYGRVDKLHWNLFKDRNHYEIPFNKKEFEAAKQWVIDTIEAIKTEVEYKPEPSSYYCQNLCGLNGKDYCPYKRLGIIYDRLYSKCYSKRNKEYESYGGAGIEMSDDWKEDKNEFFAWALNNGYSEDLVLERCNEMLGFSPDNCYWDYPRKYEYKGYEDYE